MTHAQLDALLVGDDIGAWRRLGFDGETTITIGSTSVCFGDGKGIEAAAVAGIDALDGLALSSAVERGDEGAIERHSNGVVAIDHVVVTTPNPDRTTAAFESQGVPARRVRVLDTSEGARRQTFFWLGDVICEVVGADDAAGGGDASWWGLALTVDDLDSTCERLGDLVGPPRDAVQPGRRVSTVRRSAGISVPVLFISPHSTSQR